MVLIALGSIFAMRASGFSGSVLAQEMPANVSVNRPMASSVKRIVFVIDGPAIPARRYDAYR